MSYRNFTPHRYKSGSIIDVSVRLTASHLGHFEFHLCPLKTTKELETDECFEQYPLPLADGSGYKFPIKVYRKTDYDISLILPNDVTCQQCVIRSEMKIL